LSLPLWSRVGLGCWQLGDDCWGSISEEQAFQTMKEAVEAGVTFFDTADVYGGGLSEKRIGRFLRETGAKVTVATKIGRFGDPGWPHNFTHEVMKSHIQASISRLGVESLDLVQLHCIPTLELVKGDVFDSLRGFQKEGLIKTWGVSVESVEEGLLCLTQPGLSSLQVIFNAMRQKPEEVLLPRAHQMGVRIIVRLPLASGALGSFLTKDSSFPANDHRSFNANGEAFHVGETFNGLGLEKAVEGAEKLKAALPEGWTLPHAALRWILDHAEVSTIIPGASKPGQASRNAAADQLPPLPEAVTMEWARIYRSEISPFLRGQI
jgi:aryl-alcohol dehydrogenase-like predicted oxidoreductase